MAAARRSRPPSTGWVLGAAAASTPRGCVWSCMVRCSWCRRWQGLGGGRPGRRGALLGSRRCACRRRRSLRGRRLVGRRLGRGPGRAAAARVAGARRAAACGSPPDAVRPFVVEVESRRAGRWGVAGVSCAWPRGAVVLLAACGGARSLLSGGARVAARVRSMPPAGSGLSRRRERRILRGRFRRRDPVGRHTPSWGGPVLPRRDEISERGIAVHPPERGKIRAW